MITLSSLAVSKFQPKALEDAKQTGSDPRFVQSIAKRKSSTSHSAG